jgi:triphosphatase
MGTDHQEIEWQYDAPDGLEKVEGWLDDPGGFGLLVLENSLKELADTYYDTEDWRLYRAGYALRVRRVSGEGSEATMKSLASAAGNLHRRREISELLEGNGIEALPVTTGPVGEHLRELVEPGELRPIFEVRTRRRTFDLLLDERPADLEKSQTRGSAVRIGEVALDRSEIPSGEEPARLMRVEVEVDASAAVDAPTRLKDFVEAMEEALGLRPTGISKYEAGLSATGQNPDSEANLMAGDEGREKE